MTQSDCQALHRCSSNVAAFQVCLKFEDGWPCDQPTTCAMLSVPYTSVLSQEVLCPRCVEQSQRQDDHLHQRHWPHARDTKEHSRGCIRYTCDNFISPVVTQKQLKV